MLLSHTTFVKWMSRNKNSERAKETAAKTPPQRNTLCSSSSMSKREKKNDYIKAIAASALIRTHKHTEENEGEWKKKKTGRVLEKGREMQKKDLVSLMTIRTAARATKKKGKKSCYCTHAKKKRRRMHFQLHFRLLDMLAELQTENSKKKGYAIAAHRAVTKHKRKSQMSM